MSGHQGFIEVEGVSLATLTTLTYVQLVPGDDHPITILGWGVGFNGGDVTDIPIQCRLQVQTTAGTSSARVIAQHNKARSDAFDTAGLSAFTVEPTKPGGTAGQWPAKFVHPTSGGYEIWYPVGREPGSDGGTTPDRIGLEIISGVLAATLTDTSAWIYFED